MARGRPQPPNLYGLCAWRPNLNDLARSDWAATRGSYDAAILLHHENLDFEISRQHHGGRHLRFMVV